MKKQFICGPGEYVYDTHNKETGDFDTYTDDRADTEILPALENLLIERSENLAEYVDEEYIGKIKTIKPDFPVEFKLDDSYRKTYIIWEVEADDDVPTEYIEKYIIGQSADGWGESFEQQSIFEDEDDGITYYISFSPWTPNAFCEEFR